MLTMPAGLLTEATEAAEDVAAEGPLALLLDWAEPLLYEKHRYKVLYGGRGSGKTHQMAGAIILKGTEEPLRVACVREKKNSLDESCKQNMIEWIADLGLDWFYTVRHTHIDGLNGTHIFFRGLDTVTMNAVKGWQSVDICWIEEAHVIKATALELLYPSVRKPGSEIWITFNPRYRYDPVYTRFVTRPGASDWTMRVNWNDNPFLPDVLHGERLRCLAEEPERYAHIWEGQPDDAGAVRKVLPFALLADCLAHYQDTGGRLHAGLDVADTGGDKNALVIRRGGSVVHAEQWTGDYLGDTARRVDALCKDWGVQTLYYDVGGVGAGMRSYFNEMRAGREYGAHPVNFGEAVAGPEKRYTRAHTNADFFARRNAQLAWALRLRANNTRRLVAGELGVKPGDCLLVAPRLYRAEAYLAELSQPEWSENSSGRIEVDKQPDDAPSPDLFDATCLAFAHDSRYGLARP